MNWVNALVQGILLGGTYALFASGLSLVFGVLKVVNLAHGDLTVLAAFLAVVVTSALGLSPLVGLVLLIPLMGAFGWLMARTLLQRSLEAGELVPLLVTFGLSIVIQNALLQTFSADTRSLTTGGLGTANVSLLPGITVGLLALITLAVAVGMLVGLQMFLSRTATGRAVRATSDDPQTAQLVGVDPRRIYALATAIAFGTIAVAGVFYGLRGTFTPTLGPQLLIFAFEAVIIGGIGSLRGTLTGGLVLGLAQTIGAQIQPSYGVLAGHLAFLLVLAVRPHGLFRKAPAR